MPLLPGSGQHIVGANIAELRRSGYPEKQAVAIAYGHARKHRAAAKLRLPKLALPKLATKIALPKLSMKA